MRSMSRRSWGAGLSALALALTLTFLAAGSAMADVDERVKSRKVSGNWRWALRHEYIRRGDTVRWQVPGSQNAWHDVHAYGGWSFSVSRLDPGEGRNRRFNNLGAYKYRCVRHSAKPPGEQCQGMCGTIHVINA